MHPVGVLAGARHFARNSAELLSDLPSAACLLLATLVLAEEIFQPEGPRFRIIVAAPLCAAAFYFRYGSSIPIATLAGAFLVVGHRAILRRPWPVLAMFGVFGLLLLPHVIRSVAVTGSVFGILKVSGSIPAEGDGLAAYIRDRLHTYGIVLGPLVFASVLAAPRDRTALALALAALGQITVLSITTEPQPRFIFFATVLLAALGIDGCRRLVTQVKTSLRRVATVFALGAVMTTWLAVLATAPNYVAVRSSGPAQVLISAEVIRRDRLGDGPCEVLGPDTTRLEWYSGCRAVLSATPDAPGRLYLVRNGDEPSLPGGAQRIAFLPGGLDVVRLK